MNKILIALTLSLCVLPVRFCTLEPLLPVAVTPPEPEVIVPDTKELYTEMNLDGLVDFKAFNQAVEGFYKIQRRNKELITLIDYTKSSSKKRFHVLDLKEKKVLFSSLVSHGKNSGLDVPTSFSNVSGSNKSSLGFFVTENTYKGKNGYSLRIDGVEKGINDNAKERAIVIHGSKYVNDKIIKRNGRVARSLGCPALPQAINKDVIDTIKDGSVVFIYADNKEYANKSKLININPDKAS